MILIWWVFFSLSPLIRPNQQRRLLTLLMSVPFLEKMKFFSQCKVYFAFDRLNPTDENNRLYQVDLTLTNADDGDLRVLVERTREDTPGTGWHRLGSLLFKMGPIDKAEEFYQVLLNQTTDEIEKGELYHLLAVQKAVRGEYQEALGFFEKSLEVGRKRLPPNHLSLANLYNNIGNTYDNIGEYPDALSNHEQALTIRQHSLPPNHLDLGKSYCNMGDYPKALSNYEKAIEIQQKSLPHPHPDLGSTYNSMGVMYKRMGDYPKALSNYEKAIEILQQSLPSNNPALSMSYNNIGVVYEDMKDYKKAYSFYERSVKIAEQSLPSDHPDLRDYEQSLEDMKKKL